MWAADPISYTSRCPVVTFILLPVSPPAGWNAALCFPLVSMLLPLLNSRLTRTRDGNSVFGCLANSSYFGASTFANALRISVEGQPSAQVATPVQWTREEKDPPTFVFRILSIQPNSSVPFQLSPPINAINPENQAGTVFVTFPESG
jgi:hypothetical protein